MLKIRSYQDSGVLKISATLSAMRLISKLYLHLKPADRQLPDLDAAAAAPFKMKSNNTV
jgi:hypothetical protein